MSVAYHRSNAVDDDGDGDVDDDDEHPPIRSLLCYGYVWGACGF